VKDSTQESPRILEDSAFMDEFQTGSVRSLSRRTECANGTRSGRTGRDEVASRVEAGEVAVAQECLVAEGNGVTVLVDITESEATVSIHRECTSHECQRKWRKYMFENKFGGVTGIHNGAEDVESCVQGLLGTDIIHNNDTQIIEVAWSCKLGRPDRMVLAPHVFGIGA
jgi:hypothetical protein